ncbi:JmjC domain-containing protein [Halomonadaceae bacterium KBTZ08]
MSVLGETSIETFLQDYWQKKPLIIRNAFPGIQSPVSVDELAGLACEEAVESRLVFEEENGKPWQLHSGPFEASYLQSLPEKDWTLLVQGLDHWVPEAADLLDHFRFIPNWRLDDIMASFAPVGGSVGPHFDRYDVFLLQTIGQRRWKLGGVHDNSSPRVEGSPLHILADFETQEEAVLNPGDMLYLPPGVAHWGIAENDCMTLSVGFRTPSHADVVTGVADFVADSPELDRQLTDPAPASQDNPGRISDRQINELRSILENALQDPDAIASWFGQAMTEPKHAGIVEPPEAPMDAATLQALVSDGTPLIWNEGSRFSFHDLPDEGGRLLFVDGQRFRLTGQATGIADVLCASRHPDVDALNRLLQDTALAELVASLVNQGSLYPEGDDEESDGA